jgi:hypothetical protein
MFDSNKNAQVLKLGAFFYYPIENLGKNNER